MAELMLAGELDEIAHPPGGSSPRVGLAGVGVE
jgi:hypothetical protein